MNNDYIRREDAVDDLHTQLMYRMGSDDMKRRLDDWVKTLPSVDVVPVVRCRDCKHLGTFRGKLYCRHNCGVVEPKEDDFCSYGERRKE